MAISIPIISEFSPKGIDKAIKEFQRLETAGQKAQFALKKAAIPAAAAFGALVAGITMATKAALEDAQAQTRLAKSLQNTVGATNAQIASTERFLQTLSLAAGVADDELRPALASLVRGTRDITQAQQALNLALDISAATSRSVVEVSDALAMAYGGNMRGLRSLSPEMAKMVKDGASLDQVMSALAATFGGAAAANANTAAGRLAKFNVAINEAKESLGTAFLPLLEAALPKLIQFANWANQNTDAMKKWAIAIGATTAAVVVLNFAMSANPVVALALGFIAVQTAIIKYGTAVRNAIGTTQLFNWNLNKGIGLLNAYINLANRFSILNKAFDIKVPEIPLEFGKEFKPGGFGYFGDERGAMPQKWAESTSTAIDNVTKSLGSAGAASDTFAQKVKSALGDALDSAKERLKSAADEMAKFGESVKTALLEAFSFKDAAEAGKESGGGFLAGLQAQADKVTGYASQIQQLLDMGLSKDALQEVLAAGTEAGSAIAAQLIEGGATAIEQTNRLVESAQMAADQVGLLAGEKYFGAGVKFAQDVVTGLQGELEKLTPKLMAQMDAIASRMKRTVSVDVRVNEIVQRVEARVGGIPKMAEGGIVTRPTLALIGEAGPEAVIPLSRMGQGGGAGGNIVVNINSTIADSTLPDKIVQALQSYNRRVGPVRVNIA